MIAGTVNTTGHKSSEMKAPLTVTATRAPLSPRFNRRLKVINEMPNTITRTAPARTPSDAPIVAGPVTPPSNSTTPRMTHNTEAAVTAPGEPPGSRAHPQTHRAPQASDEAREPAEGS